MPCEKLTAFLDGQLSPEEADAVQLHLAECARCQHELHALMQLEAMGLALGEEIKQTHPVPQLAGEGRDGSGVAKVIPLRPRRSSTLLALPLVFIAAAAAVLLLWCRHDPDPGPHLAAATLPGLGPNRLIEGRLSYPGADHYRPYETQRAAGRPAVEHIPTEAVVELEKGGDEHGAAAAWVLMGIRAQAVHHLDIAARNVKNPRDIESDRALLALTEGDPETALEILDRVLEYEPRHSQALWNRALALRELGLLRSAAQTFDEVAALNEPGWHQEAREQAEKLRALADERRASWTDVKARGEALITTGQGLSPADVGAWPDLVRHYFYGALRVTASPERIEALRPLARALDEHYGGTLLSDRLDRVSRSDLGQRASLVRVYQELADGDTHDPEVARQWLAKGERIAPEAADVLLGIANYTGARRLEIPLALMPVYQRLAEKIGDPWFTLVAAELEAYGHRMQGDHAGAERILSQALITCEAVRIELRCVYIEHALGHGYVGLHRISDARRNLMDAWSRARRANHWELEQLLLKQLLECAFRQNDSGTGSIATARAYLDELALRDPSCDNRLYRHRLLATMLVIQNRLEAAHQELERASELLASDRSCKEPPFSSQVALAQAYVLNHHDDPAERAALQARLEAFRGAAADNPGWLAFADHIEGRLLISRDRIAAHALLRRAIARADERPAEDIAARKARAHSYMLLILDASAHGEHDQALAGIAEEQGLEAATRCALGVAAEHDVVVVARGADGAVVATRQPFGTEGIAADRVVSEEVRRALAGCEIIDVYARAPYYGSPRLLPADLAWRFRARRPADISPGAPRRRVIVADVEPPAELDLPTLTLHRAAPDAMMLRGPAATPRAVLRAVADATEIEVHAHGILDINQADTAFLALSEDNAGRFQLTADDIRQERLAGAPTVFLGACHAGYTTRFFHGPSSLASAFMEAGARTVIASPAPIPDKDSTVVFESLRQRVAAGQPVAKALRDMRMQATGAELREWIAEVVVFE